MKFMNILMNIILFLIISQLTTVSHEFGHVIPALLFTEGDVRLILGNNSNKIKNLNLKG